MSYFCVARASGPAPTHATPNSPPFSCSPHHTPNSSIEYIRAIPERSMDRFQVRTHCPCSALLFVPMCLSRRDHRMACTTQAMSNSARPYGTTVAPTTYPAYLGTVPYRTIELPAYRTCRTYVCMSQRALCHPPTPRYRTYGGVPMEAQGAFATRVSLVAIRGLRYFFVLCMCVYVC